MNKKKKAKVLQEMIDSKNNSSRTQKIGNKVFKEQKTLKTVLKEKREKKKKLNTQKYFKVKIKKAKD